MICILNIYIINVTYFVYFLLLGVDEYKIKRETIKEKLKKNLNQDTLNSSQLKLASDYYNDSEMSVKFKKVKVFLYIINIVKCSFYIGFVFREKS